MRNIKRITALILAFVMAFCLVACHPKDEVAISSGDYEITSAMYSYFLVMADMEARNYVSDNFDTTAKNFDYLKQEIEGKSYTDYVKDLALEHCYRAIAYQKLCDDNGLTLDTDAIANADYLASYNWYYYGYTYGYQFGYGDFMPQNGVSYETYQEAMRINFYGDTYFRHLYDKGGEKEIPEADIQSTLDSNYAAVYLISKTYTDATLSDVKMQFEKYKERLQNGEDFETINKEFEKSENKDTTSSDTTSSESTTSSAESTTVSSDATSSAESSESTSSDSTSSETVEEDAPEDELIQIVGSDETDAEYKFAKFADVKTMELGDVKLIEDSESKTLYLVVKKDINADNYYIENLRSDILYSIKGDEFEENVKAFIDSLDYEVSKFAINQFKVKNIFVG